MTWGGAGDAVACHDGDGHLYPLVLRAVELFDPDVWIDHLPTYRGLQLADPAAYDDLLNANTSESLPRTVRCPWRPGGRRSTSSFGGKRCPSGNRVRRHDANWVEYRAPYFDPGLGVDEVVQDDSLPTGMLVDQTKLSPPADRILVPDTSGLPLLLEVLIASRWGRLSPAARQRLVEVGTEIVDVAVGGENLKRTLRACWGGRTSDAARPMSITAALGEALHHEDMVSYANFDEAGPFSFSLVGCGTCSRCAFG